MIRLSSLFALIVLWIATVSAEAAGRTYHLDATGGSDANDGLTPQTAWKSLEKFNATTFAAGDCILLKSGERWAGQMRPQGLGVKTEEQADPIRLGRYGEGELPCVDGEGAVLDTLLVEDVEHWIIEDLQVTNQGPATAPRRTGVRVSARASKPMRDITLRRLHVHDVNGDLRKAREGCGIFFEADGRQGAFFDGLLIEGCRVERTDRNGICQRGGGAVRSRNVIIRGNRLEDIGGDGIKLWGTNGGIIEHNMVRGCRMRAEDHAAGIWPFDCDDTVIQFNEVSGTRGIKDGQGFDADYRCRRTLIQYNYSHHNEGGFILVCAPGRAINEDTVVRYNISAHDGLDTSRVIQIAGNVARAHFYNNTIIVRPRDNMPLISFNAWDGSSAAGTRFTNNLFLVSGTGRATYVPDQSQDTRFEHNVFAGRHEGLPAGVSVAKDAPALAGAMEPESGPAWLKNLQPRSREDFPRGVWLEGNGMRDYFGVRLKENEPPAVGAAE